MTLSRLSVRRPVAVMMCVLSLIVFGYTSVAGMPMESTPEMAMPYYAVVTRYAGATPEEVDKTVTKPLEGVLSGLKNLDSITGQSSEGQSFLLLQFEYGVNTDKTYNDITKALNMMRFSDDVNDPVIMEMAMDTSAVMNISITSKGDANLYTYIEDNVLPEFENISGVASVSMSGGRAEYVRIRLREEEMLQYGLTMESIAAYIAAADTTVSAGEMRRGNTTVGLMGKVSYDSYELLSTIPLTLATGDVIQLSDVADVELATQKATSFSRQDGVETISLSITKNQSANTVGLCDRLKAKAEELNGENLGLKLEVTYNAGKEIVDSIMDVVKTLLLGLVLAVVVLLLYLGDWRGSLIVGISMPLSVFAALVAMSWLDMTINLLSMGGLVIGVGMMVDNSIVVLDSCFRAQDTEPDYAEAAIRGANLVNSAVIASTLTTVVVFLPIALLKGFSGQIFKDVGYTITISLVASLVSALTMVPLLFVRFKARESAKSLMAKPMRAIENLYVRILPAVLSHQLITLACAVGLVILTIVMFGRLDMELLPQEDAGTVRVSVQTKTGLNVEETDSILRRIEAIVAADPEVDSYSIYGSSGSASVSVTLKEERTITTDEFVASLREKSADIDNCEVSVRSSGMMSLDLQSVELDVKGNILEVVKEAAQEIRDALNNSGMFDSVKVASATGTPRAELVVDPVQAAAMGTTPAAVLVSVKNMVAGLSAGKIQDGNQEWSIKIEYPEGRFEDVSSLAGLMLRTNKGQMVPLTDLAEVRFTSSPASISRIDGRYYVAVTITPPVGMTAAAAKLRADAIIDTLDLPSGITYAPGGATQMMNEEFSKIYTALFTAVFLVFVVMAIQFESVRFSLVVMFSVPFAMTGAFLGLLLTGQSISMTSLLGLIMLVGIVVNNAIVLIDYSSILRREEGLSVRESLLVAGRTRLRPIFMTTLTTIFGLVPTAFGIGGEVEMMQSMSVVVISGLTFSTLVTLLLVPSMCLLFDGEERRARKAAKKAAKAAAEA